MLHLLRSLLIGKKWEHTSKNLLSCHVLVTYSHFDIIQYVFSYWRTLLWGQWQWSAHTKWLWGIKIKGCFGFYDREVAAFFFFFPSRDSSTSSSPDSNLSVTMTLVLQDQGLCDLVPSEQNSRRRHWKARMLALPLGKIHIRVD